MGCVGSVLDLLLSLRDRQSTLSTRDSTMTTPDYKALCAELLDKYDLEWRARERIKAALAAEPVPLAAGEVAELVAELRHFLAGYQQMRGLDPEHIYSIHRGDAMEAHLRVSRLARAADLMERLASPACVVLKPSPELIEAFKDALPGRIEPLPDDAQVIEPATHTILVPVPAPVPVSERLPGPGDCDGEGRCWVHQPHEACPESPAWELMLAKYASPSCGATCWLPATALPLPAGEVQP
jgi:hypothetical protein